MGVGSTIVITVLCLLLGASSLVQVGWKSASYWLASLVALPYLMRDYLITRNAVRLCCILSLWLYYSTLVINITPTGRKAVIVNESLTITCTATGCDNSSYYIQLFPLDGSILSDNGFSSFINATCLACNFSSAAVTKDIVLRCGFVEAKPEDKCPMTYYSEVLEILVQS